MDDNNNYHNGGNSVAPEHDLLLISHCFPNSKYEHYQENNSHTRSADNKSVTRSEYVIIYLLCSRL